MHKSKFDNVNKDQPYIIKRYARLSYIARCKLRLSQLYLSKGSLLGAFMVSSDNFYEDWDFKKTVKDFDAAPLLKEEKKVV